jgi:hypothetical protein
VRRLSQKRAGGINCVPFPRRTIRNAKDFAKFYSLGLDPDCSLDRALKRLSETVPSKCDGNIRVCNTSQILRFKLFAEIDGPSRNHEHTFASIMESLWIFRRSGDMSLHDFPDKETVFGNLASIGKLAFKVRITLLDQGSAHLCGRQGREFESLELVDFGTRTVANADGLIDEVGGGKVDDAFLAFGYKLEAVIGLPDVTGEESGYEFHHHVPAHGHDVRFALPSRTNEYNGAGLQITADVVQWKIFFME